LLFADVFDFAIDPLMTLVVMELPDYVAGMEVRCGLGL